nr:MAG TPA: hypothetical protein [Caudoviricetes sp.]
MINLKSQIFFYKNVRKKIFFEYNPILGKLQNMAFYFVLSYKNKKVTLWKK